MSVFSHSEFDAHELVAFRHDAASGLRAIIAVHSTRLGPGLGGCRMYPYASDAEALTEAKVCRFERAAFDGFLRDNPDVALRLLQMASGDLEQAARHEVLLGRKTAVERIATFLLDLRDRSGARHLRTHPLALPMTRGEIADYTGLTIETVSRTLRRLKAEEVIELVGTGAVRVLDDDRLVRLSGST